MLVAELVIYSSPKLLINPRLTYLTNLANIIYYTRSKLCGSTLWQP